VLGLVVPVKEIIEMAHRNATIVVIDAAQALAHCPVDVHELNCDFLVGSGHKMYAPMGVGFLYGKREHMEKLPPYHGGSNMMIDVSFSDFSLADIPGRFEAGTPNVAGVFGLREAIQYLSSCDRNAVERHEKVLVRHLEMQLRELPPVDVIGVFPGRTSVLSFTVRRVHSHDIATALSVENVAVRAGYHCCQPLMKKLGLRAGAVRVSFGMYNTLDDCDRLIAALKKSFKTFRV
jgi:selenocysteine lyase/cysteine desulfurase